MRGPGDAGRRAGRVGRTIRLMIVANGVALLLLSLVSAANYASVVVAHATVYVVPRYTLNFSETNPDGTLTTNGSVMVRLSLIVVNPSARTLRFHLVAYQGWIEDLPAEAGLPVSRSPPDDRLVDANGTRLFYPAFLDSREIESGSIPSFGNGTLDLSYVLTRRVNPWVFDAVRNITDYAAAVRGSPAGVAWNHWVRVQIDIEGVLEATSPTASAHMRTLKRIEREEGINLGSA